MLSVRSAAAMILVLTLGAAGCGGGSGKSVAVTPTTTATTTTTPGARSNQAFLQCMQNHGVNITSLRGVRGGSTPSTLPAGVTAAQFQQAFQACRSQLPTGGQFRNNPAFAAYRNCLTLHGVTLPQRGQGPGGTGPSTTGGAGGGGGGVGGGAGLGGLDRTNPTVQAALAACAPLLPSGGPGGSTTTPTT